MSTCSVLCWSPFAAWTALSHGGRASNRPLKVCCSNYFKSCKVDQTCSSDKASFLHGSVVPFWCSCVRCWFFRWVTGQHGPDCSEPVQPQPQQTDSWTFSAVWAAGKTWSCTLLLSVWRDHGPVCSVYTIRFKWSSVLERHQRKYWIQFRLNPTVTMVTIISHDRKLYANSSLIPLWHIHNTFTWLLPVSNVIISDFMFPLNSFKICRLIKPFENNFNCCRTVLCLYCYFFVKLYQYKYVYSQHSAEFCLLDKLSSSSTRQQMANIDGTDVWVALWWKTQLVVEMI